jgi:hypothetical protein
VADPASGNGGALPPEWIAPDDARELDVDLRALRRERAAEIRRARREAVLSRQRRLYGAPLFVVALVLLGVVAVGAGVLVAAPVGLPTRSAARPLANPTGSPGTTDALLPAVTLRVGGQLRPARALRPAVLALVPVPCGCDTALQGMAEEAGQYALPVVLIIAAQNQEIAALLRAARATRVYSALDATSALAKAYAARGLTVLLVRADGVVTTVARQLTAGRHFGAALSDLA